MRGQIKKGRGGIKKKAKCDETLLFIITVKVCMWHYMYSTGATISDRKSMFSLLFTFFLTLNVK